jgi:hypothetical protein
MGNPLGQFDARTILAFLITLFAITSTSVLSVTIIASGKPDDIEDRASLVLNATLPLLGTWVGTVLAYYFARENFEAASRSTERLTQLSSSSSRGDLQFIPVSIAMIPISKMFFFDRIEMNIHEVLSKLDERELRRLPILQPDTHFPKRLVYYEDLVRYYYPKKEDERQSLTLETFLDNTQTPMRPFALIDSKATLALAKESMRRQSPDCRDVFVTESGKPDSAVIGYLTNLDIEKFSQV